MFTRKHLGNLIGALSLTTACMTTGAIAAQNTTVETANSTITGIANKDGSQFLGIPFAQPPVGALRWQPPQPVTDFPEQFAATEFGSNCPQAPSPFGQPSLNEDCLYLNVYRPKGNFNGNRRVPVMVWIHGGAFTYGGGELYDPTPLTDKGVMVVTINYRIGALGFMAHPALTATSSSGTSGNFGIMDQQAALQWVQDNIEDFGGDADNVTVFGQSAGGLSTHAHLASPGSAGLLDKAIIQSGAYLLEQPTMQEWEYLGLGVAAQAGCADQSPACLRSLPVETILANQDPGALGWLPIVDGNVLPTTMKAALASGDFNQVPVMEGTTKDEYTMFTALSYDLTGNPLTPATYQDAIIELGFPAAIAPLIALLYPPFLYENTGAAFSAMGTDMLFSCNSQTSMNLLSQYVPVYGYEFADRNAPYTSLPPVSFSYGAVHGSEIQYVMNTVGGGELDKNQQKLSKQMIKFWSNFAKTGNPNGELTVWHSYSPAVQTMMSLQPPQALPTYTFAYDHKCGIWNAIFSLQ